jgi:hypothetical protein
MLLASPGVTGGAEDKQAHLGIADGTRITLIKVADSAGIRRYHADARLRRCGCLHKAAEWQGTVVSTVLLCTVSAPPLWASMHHASAGVAVVNLLLFW